jgi:hypothetical protein
MSDTEVAKEAVDNFGQLYGSIDLDSTLPDVRITLGGPAQDPFTAEVLAAAGPAAAGVLAAQLEAGASARLWVPAAVSREQAFGPGADVRGARDLPVLIVAGDDLAAAIAAVTADLADAEIEAPAAPADPAGPAGPPVPDLAGRSVALLNRGTPSSLVTPDGTLYISLMRSCSGWPCGVWIDGDARTAPDGTSFAWQHWSHTFSTRWPPGRVTGRAPGLRWPGSTITATCSPARRLHRARCPPRRAWRPRRRTPPSWPRSCRGGNRCLRPPAAPARDDGVTVRLRDVSGQASRTGCTVCAWRPGWRRRAAPARPRSRTASRCRCVTARRPPRCRPPAR